MKLGTCGQLVGYIVQSCSPPARPPPHFCLGTGRNERPWLTRLYLSWAILATRAILRDGTCNELVHPFVHSPLRRPYNMCTHRKPRSMSCFFEAVCAYGLYYDSCFLTILMGRFFNSRYNQGKTDESLGQAGNSVGWVRSCFHHFSSLISLLLPSCFC